jgi:transposase InsO family protein
VTAQPTYPGCAFADAEASYAEAMAAFVAASPPRIRPPADDRLPPVPPAPDQSVEQAALRQEAAALRDQRRRMRQQRQQEDAAWHDLRQEHQSVAINPFGDLTTRLGEGDLWPHDHSWTELRQQRRTTLERRGQEDTAWREARERLRDRLPSVGAPPAWIAILVVTDSCSRQSLGLPLFEAGAKVTATMVVRALRTLLPPDLQFLISDRGVHFTSHEFAHLATTAEFVHVLIARHRPESNGIAERFVRTLKEWLADKTWEAAAELAGLLAHYEAEYNDRPHQGLGLPGLSPNEFAQRVWLM